MALRRARLERQREANENVGQPDAPDAAADAAAAQQLARIAAINDVMAASR